MRKLIVGAVAVLLASGVARGQALPAGIGPGSYIQVGGSASLFQLDYGKQKLGGGALFLDAHLYRRVGAEVEVRSLDLHESEGVHETTYLVGPKISLMRYGFRPYAKLLAGRGEFYYPFNYAKGSYFVVAAGGGVDWHVRGTRLTVRLVDFEMQDWPGFSFGAIHPYGIGTGVAWTIFAPRQ